MSNDKPLPARTGGGFGLRFKLSLGFVGLLAILLAVGVESIALLGSLGGSIDVILRENYKSVIACERMKESLERMDSGALFALAGHSEQGSALAAEHRPRFEAALQTELGNVTLPGEGERAERLRQLFTAYAPVLERVLDPRIPLEERRSLYFQTLFPTFQQIKAAADEILDMNQQNMVDANDRARALASRASRFMAILLLTGTAFAGICIAFLFRTVLVPVERLTQSARLAGAARDLEAALGPVRSTLASLDAEPSPLSSRQEELLEGVRREADTLGRIARNLRELAQTEDQRHPLDREPAAPRDLAAAAIEEAALSADRAGVKLVLDADPALPSVLADRKRLGVALAALLQNAIAHSSAGGEVTVRAVAEEGGVRFAVIDGGRGIPAEHLSRVFEPFYQVPGTEDLGGVGLGLTIARDIVRAHGGEMDVKSTEGRGATFRFRLSAAVLLFLCVVLAAGRVDVSFDRGLTGDAPDWLFGLGLAARF